MEGLIIGKNSLKQLKTASTRSPWAYIRRAYYRKDFCV